MSLRTSMLGRCVGVLLCGLLLGCGAAKTTVSGAVTLDGQPLEKGRIQMVRADGGGPTAAADVVAGQYTLELPEAGTMKVEISAQKVVGQRPAYAGDPNSPMIESVEPIIPPQYNVNSTLTVEIVAGANTGKDFAVTSK